MDITIDAKNAVISSSYREDCVEISIEDVKKSDILDNFIIEDILEHFDVHKILDLIGETEVKDYFDLVNREV